ncbi:uncharacterized protein A4U43_C10F2840 [Asparagus officinalis]|uniref:DUF1990 domain-containing protein n=1 Tax=Asparagus officinalis TaxID=4686 RepID=A0A5P1E1Z1_ASPOF|nr:UPF0548 protein At2g17695 [Asparagus officinalis]ONK55973.1 uncharacterized protein A4U43_C10F2840 [Asparagus officinalis]
MVAGLLLSLTRPSTEQQKSCVESSGDFNYGSSFRCSSSSYDEAVEKTLADAGFFINRSRVLLGSGPTTFNLAKSALLSWRHFALGWAFVDPKTPVEKGTKFCVCVKELIPWIVMPLQIAYVSQTSQAVAGRPKGSFGFGSGTLHGHLLAGEESFSIEWDENDKVWYEIFSFSKPAHLLSAVGYPYVKMRQRLFAQQSAQELLNHIKSQQLKD